MQFSSGVHTLICGLTRLENYWDYLPRVSFSKILTSTEKDESEKVELVLPLLDEAGNRVRIIKRLSEVGKYYKELYLSTGDYDRNKIPLQEIFYLNGINNKYGFICLPNSRWYENIEFEYEEEKQISKADAVIVCISALEPLDKNDKEYIAKHFAGKQKKNMFFVVNKINLLNSDAELEQLKDYIQSELKSVFTDKKGVFNKKLFDERVFYVDAYGAMNTRLGRTTYITRNFKVMVPEEETGILAFEKALYGFIG